MEDSYVPLLYYWGGVYFLIFWCAMLWVVSRFSGWNELAKRYPLENHEADDVEWHAWDFGRFQLGCGYKGCLWIGFSPEGLFLKTGPDLIFRVAHPPLMIPWRCITPMGQHRGLWRDLLKLRIEGMDFTISLSENTMRHAARWLPEQASAQNSAE